MMKNSSPAGDAPALHVLVAEDNRTYRTLVSALLAKWGCSVTTVVDGRSAVDACANRNFDFVLMDLEMPEMDGLTATRLIREREKTAGRRTRIIATTASDAESDRERCRQAGMDGCVPKSASAQELFDGIRQLSGVSLRTAAASLPVQPSKPAADERVAGNGHEHVEIEVAEAFLEEGPQLLERIQNALKRHAASEMADAAHALKGASAHVHGPAVLRLAHALERAGRAGDLHESPIVLEQLSLEMDRLLSALKSLAGR